MPRLVHAALLALCLAAPAFAEVKAGDFAPVFTLKDQDGKDVKLSSFRGQKNVLLAFYPKDFTPGCTNEMKCLVKENRKIQARDFVVLAISADPVESHSRFAATLGVTFRLLADTDLAVARQYDVVSPSAGGAFAMRSAFLVDKEGKVRYVDRDLKAPVGTLEGTELLAQIEKVAGVVDPVAALSELSPAERGGKTAFIRLVQALLAEDIPALEAVLDAEACAKAGEPPQMQRERRKALVEKWRLFFEKHDVRSLRFADVADVTGTRVFTKEAATPAALTAFGSDAREVAARLAEGEMLVIGRTNAPKLGDVPFLAREVVLRVRKRGEAWTIVEIVG